MKIRKRIDRSAINHKTKDDTLDYSRKINKDFANLSRKDLESTEDLIDTGVTGLKPNEGDCLIFVGGKWVNVDLTAYIENVLQENSLI